MRISKKTLASSIGSALGLMVLATAPAIAASTFSNNLWQFASGNGASIIDFNKGASGIWDNGEMHIATDNFMFLDAPNRVSVSNALFVGQGPLIVSQTAQADTFNAVSSVHSDGTISAGGAVSATGGFVGNLTGNVTGNVTSEVTRATGATGSFQNIAADLTYEGAAGSTSAFHAPVMGHFHGDTLTNNNPSYHAGVIGAYSATTSDAVTGPKAGVVGAINVDGGSNGVADAAVMAVLDGGDPGEAVTAGAAYGVQYINANANAKFDYGLDLSHAAVGDLKAVTYGTADIRLASGATISSGSARPDTCVTGSLFLDTDGGTDATLLACTSTDNWETVDTSIIGV